MLPKHRKEREWKHKKPDSCFQKNKNNAFGSKDLLVLATTFKELEIMEAILQKRRSILASIIMETWILAAKRKGAWCVRYTDFPNTLCCFAEALFGLEDYDNLAVLVGVCDPLLDLVALKSLDESLDGIFVLVAGLDCDDVDVRAVCTFDNETVLGC